ncbi:MAG: MBL fold metallo-hydrolase, partial [Chitinophagaceae bacterium]|nr:MBL fold metallo-hydrolase [Chitinophagaceae bacterium]
MKIFSFIILLIIAVGFLPQNNFAQFRRKKEIKTSLNFNIQQLAPGVWAAINNDNYGKAICNAGIVDLGQQTLVFDPFMNPAVAAELKDVAKQLTGKDVTIVVNSHYHNDHIRGDQAFIPNATIISTTTTKASIEANEPDEREWEKAYAPTLLQALKTRLSNSNSSEKEELPYWIGYYEGLVESSSDLFLAVPDQTFDDSLWIEGSKLSIKLVERKNGHTSSDAVLLIPSLGIAFMGDLLCNERHPWLSDGNIEGWRKSLKIFYEDTTYHTYLPGHGAVTDKPALKILYEYLGDMQSWCNAATTDSAQTALINQSVPYPYNSWHSVKFYQPNLQFLINQAKAKARSSTT